MSDLGATRAFYGRWARFYDVLATAPGIRSWRARAVDALELEPGATVVEMGVGTGANLPHLRDAVGDAGRVVGLDVTPRMLAIARDRVAEAGWENVSLVRADAEGVPVRGPIDAVIGTFVVGMFGAPDQTIRRWAAVLGPGGRLALLDAARSDRPLARLLNTGFSLFVRLTAPGTGSGTPVAQLESRLDAAAAALEASAAVTGAERLAGGFIRLEWGQVEHEASRPVW